MKKIKLLKTGIIAAIITFSLIGFNLAHAATTNMPNVNELLHPFTMTTQQAPTTTDYIASLPDTSSPTTFIGKAVYFMLIIANILAFVSFVGSGVFMVMSMGDTEMLKKAKTIFTYTVFAMVICATALAIVTGFTNINFFNP